MILLQIVIFQQRKCHNAIISGSCAYYSPKLEDTYYSQIIPGIICQSLLAKQRSVILTLGGLKQTRIQMHNIILRNYYAMRYQVL